MSTAAEHAEPTGQASWVEQSNQDPARNREIALVDLLDRLLAGGVVLTGDLTLSIADVDLVHISLRALITSISADRPSPWARGGSDG